MMHGTKPTPIDHRDFDLHKSFGIPTVLVFPDSYNTDAGLWCPDQNAPEPIFNNPALPFGCTDYTQADLPADEINKLQNPIFLETITRANARGGIDIREALKAAQQLHWIDTYYNIRSYAPLDWFDAIRYAMISGVPERRSVSLGWPWFPQFESVDTSGIESMPYSLNVSNVGWHNHKIAGWKLINGIPYLISKSWQGSTFGDKGYIYFSREIVNSVMQISGTVAYTVTRNQPPAIKTVDVSIVQWILSHLRQLLPLRY